MAQVERNEREDRDHYLVVASVVSSAQALLNGFSEWIESECVDLQERLNFAKLMMQVGKKRQRVVRALARIDDIQMVQLLDCRNDLKDRIKEISDGAYDSVIEARRHVDAPCMRFEAMVTELLNYRLLSDSADD